MSRFHPLLACALLFIVVAGGRSALAAGVEVERDGTVVVTTDLARPLAAVRATLDREVLDPTRSPEVVRAQVVRRRGRCDEVASTVRGGPVELDYTALRCPTADGWEIDLLDSDDMTALAVQWRLEERGGSTRLVFRIRSVADMPVPEAVQRKLLRRSALRTVERFERLAVSRARSA